MNSRNNKLCAANRNFGPAISASEAAGRSLRDLQKSPCALTKLDCGTARAEGVLASSISAVRNRGEVYSKSVFDALAQDSPVDADRLKKAAVTSDGHVIFE